MKWCGKCKEWKEESEFYKDKRRRDELTYSCKECQKRRSPNYNKKATSIDNNQKRCSKCKEIKDKIEFQNASDQKSGLSCQCRLCKSKNYQKNKEKITKQVHAYKKERMKRDPLFKLKETISNCIRLSMRKQGYVKKSHTYELLCCSYEEFTIHLGPKPEGDIELDHICPITQGKTEWEVTKLQHYTNFQWLTAEENGPSCKWNHWTPKGGELCKELLNRGWID